MRPPQNSLANIILSPVISFAMLTPFLSFMSEKSKVALAEFVAYPESSFSKTTLVMDDWVRVPDIIGLKSYPPFLTLTTEAPMTSTPPYTTLASLVSPSTTVFMGSLLKVVVSFLSTPPCLPPPTFISSWILCLRPFLSV